MKRHFTRQDPQMASTTGHQEMGAQPMVRHHDTPVRGTELRSGCPRQEGLVPWEAGVFRKQQAAVKNFLSVTEIPTVS